MRTFPRFLGAVIALPRDAFIQLYDTFVRVCGPVALTYLTRLLQLILAATVALNLVTLLHLSDLLANPRRGSWLALLLVLNYFCWSKISALRHVVRQHQLSKDSVRDK